MMIKILVIQSINNPDERADYLINDRLSFMRFLGLGLSDRVAASEQGGDGGRRILPRPRL
jgi:transposase, IS5 family